MGSKLAKENSHKAVSHHKSFGQKMVAQPLHILKKEMVHSLMEWNGLKPPVAVMYNPFV